MAGCSTTTTNFDEYLNSIGNVDFDEIGLVRCQNHADTAAAAREIKNSICRLFCPIVSCDHALVGQNNRER